MATIVLVSIIGYFALSSIFMIALLRSAARTSEDWTTSIAPTNEVPAQTAADAGQACDVAILVPSPTAPDRQHSLAKHIIST